MKLLKRRCGLGDRIRKVSAIDRQHLSSRRWLNLGVDHGHHSLRMQPQLDGLRKLDVDPVEVASRRRCDKNERIDALKTLDYTRWKSIVRRPVAVGEDPDHAFLRSDPGHPVHGSEFI